MKIIKVEGCCGCPLIIMKRLKDNLDGFCRRTLETLDISWSVNPYYVHPDCPLEDAEEKE